MLLGQNYAASVNALSKIFDPHIGQIIVGRATFQESITSIFLQCGRKWGKTEIAAYISWRIAQMIPNSPIYYFAPLSNQAREIVWEPGRFPNFGPREWLLDGPRGIDNQSMRLRFKNGSFIKVDGSDNFEKHRGVFFKLAIYDEYKDMKRGIRAAMRPNAAVLNGIELIMGSPPDRECNYTFEARDHKEDPKKRFFQMPTWINPHIDKNWLLEEKASYIRRGAYDEFEREYGAKFVKGGASKVFPMLSEAMIRPHDQMLDELRRERRSIDWYCITDPAAASTWAVCYVAHNRKTQKIRVVSEVYEQKQLEMTTRKIGNRIRETLNELHDEVEDWRLIYDEAEKWFQNEMLEAFDLYFKPTNKVSNPKGSGLTLLKDAMLMGLFEISDKCPKVFWELDNYYKTENGDIPKENDHLIDCIRYFMGAAKYSLNEIKDKEYSPDERRRVTLAEDFRHIMMEDY